MRLFRRGRRFLSPWKRFCKLPGSSGRPLVLQESSNQHFSWIFISWLKLWAPWFLLFLQAEADRAFVNQDKWIKMSILSIAGASRFSSDRTVSEYAKRTWRIEPCRCPFWFYYIPSQNAWARYQQFHCDNCCNMFVSLFFLRVHVGLQSKMTASATWVYDVAR